MSDFIFKPNRLKHLCCPPAIDKMKINSSTLISRFPCRIKMSMKINSAIGSSNHTQCYTVANETLNAYGKWVGCPGGSGPGYSSTMRYVPNELSSGLGPITGGSICGCYTPAPIIPANSSAVVILGNTIVGSTLTTTGGTWSGSPTPTITYQWYRGIILITGQVATTYVTQVIDAGQAITCKVTATNVSGSLVIVSNVITPTTLPVNTSSAPPVISGNTIFGSTLTTTSGSWTGIPTPTFTYQWYRGTILITGQIATTYATQDIDVGQAITCKVTATNVSGSAVIASNVIIPTAPPVPPTVLLINTNNFSRNINTSTYYLAQGSNPYVMPAGSFMTSFNVIIAGTNIVMNFKNNIDTVLFTWTDNQSRTVSTSTTVNLDGAVNISGCSKFTFVNNSGALAASTVIGTASISTLGILIYGYTIP